MSDRTKTYQSVKTVIKELLGVVEKDITLESRLVEDLKLDDISSLEFIIALEEHFNIDLPDEKTYQMKTVLDVVEGLVNLLKDPVPAPPARKSARIDPNR